MTKLAKNPPKVFWNQLRKKKSAYNNNDSTPSTDDFFYHFKDLLGNKSTDQPSDFNISEENQVHVDELDTIIMVNEVIDAIKLLKRGKSCGTDKVIGEIFIDAADFILAPVLCKLFNYMIDNCIDPDDGTSGIIAPIPKKGNLREVNNYRGITITSTFSKIFSIILNKRLRTWAENSNIFNQAQFGFRTQKVQLIVYLYCIL